MNLCRSFEKYADQLYVVFRVLVGVLFFLHGTQKLFGGNPLEVNLMLLAGIIELGAGALIVLGLFTRMAAGVAAIQMLVAYFYVHFAGGWNPLVNKGELALLYFAAFLVIAAWGNRRWSLEHAIFKKEVF